MRRAIKQRSIGRAGRVTASFGVSVYRGEGDCERLIEQADQYLYVAKQNGRDRVMGPSSEVGPAPPTDFFSGTLLTKSARRRA
jgi:predicted signal transduction protein with EAL and GGDEF domain